MLLPMIVVISIVLSLGFAYALPLEDYSEMPTKKSVNKILKFCADNANTSLTNETIASLNLSQFYSDYTCDEAKQAKSLLKSDNPNANNSTTVTMIP